MNFQGNPSRRFFWLDWVRFGAAFWVLVFHARNGNWTAWENLEAHFKNKLTLVFFGITRTGPEAVYIFFVLSGFLVGGKVIEKVMLGKFSIRDYVIERTSRLFVPLLPALLFTAGLGRLDCQPISFTQLLGNALGLQNIFCDVFAGNDPLWSLSYEMWFYLLAGFFALTLTSNSSHRVRCFAILGVAVGFAAFTKLSSFYLYCWCLGAISYSLLSGRAGGIWFLFGLLNSVLGCFLSQVSWGGASVWLKTAPWLVSSRELAILTFCLGLGLILPFLAQLKPGQGFLARFELAGSRLAGFSYTLYLTHVPVLHFWEFHLQKRFATFDSPSLLCYGAKLGTCLAIAWLMYLPFEAQTERVRNWLRRWCVAPAKTGVARNL